MSPLSAAIVLSDPTLREEAIACMNNLPVRIVSDQKSLDDAEDLLDRIERHRADVLLLEGRLLKTPLEEFTRRLKLTASDPVVFILQNEAVAADILEAMQAGAREYLCPPLEGELKEAFRRLAAVRDDQVSSQQRKLGRIYGFLSAKGGCGATTFASHVAPAAAQHAGKPMLLADLDFEAGLLRFILKAKSRYSLRDAVDNMHRMDSSYWHALVTQHGPHLEFIAAPEELTERTAPEPRNLARLLRFIRTTYACAVVDFGRWHSGAALESLAETESLFLVVTQELYALENAREFIRTARERGKGADRIKVLLNRVPARHKPDLDGIESYLGVRPCGVFSDDAEALYEIWSEGRMLGGDSTLGRQLAALAKSLAEPEAPEPAANAGNGGSDAPGKAWLSRAGLLGRLAGAREQEARPAAPAGGGKWLSFMRKSRA